MEKKKIGLGGCILLGIGAIVGAGIFGTLPTVINDIGTGVIFALLGAAIVIVFRSFVMAYLGAALPTSGASFMYCAKLVHPIVGILTAISNILMPTMISLFGILFATYFSVLFPNTGLSETLISVIMICVFAVLAWFGSKAIVSINNIIVALLMITIALFVFLGLPHIDSNNISFMSVIKPGVGITGISAAIGVLSSSLSGASSVMEISDDVKNPGRNVPLTLILCPVIVAVIYILMAVVTIGIVPYAEVGTLSDVASHFMSPGLVTFFVVGGPIAGIITSLVPVLLACVALVENSAKQGFLPEIFTKKNKHDVAWFTLIVVTVIAVVICATGATFGTVMTVFSLANTLPCIPMMLAPFKAMKLYPKCCANSTLKMNSVIIKVISVATCIVMAYLCWEMIVTLDLVSACVTIGTIVVGYIYVFIRAKYLKKSPIHQNMASEIQREMSHEVNRCLARIGGP